MLFQLVYTTDKILNFRNECCIRRVLPSYQYGTVILRKFYANVYPLNCPVMCRDEVGVGAACDDCEARRCPEEGDWG